MHRLTQLVAAEHVRDLLRTAERERRLDYQPPPRRKIVLRSPIALVRRETPACC